MPPLTTAALRAQLAAGAIVPLYMLVGADEIERAAVAAEFVELVEEDLRAFNVDRLHGGETTVDRLAECAQTLPMLAARRIVIVLEAEKLLVPKREGKTAERDQDRLERLLQSVPRETVMVLTCGSLDMRRRAVKILVKEACIVECGTIEDAADAQRWVKARATRAGVVLEQAAIRLLVDRAGPDLTRLRAGLDRVMLYALGQSTITADDVRQTVPATAETQVDFGIAKAIWRNDAREALRELDLSLEAGAMPVMVLGQLRVAAEKLPARCLEQAVEAVFRTDLALKSSGGDPRTLLERLVVELCSDSTGRRASPYQR
jgi:DNA polymerase III subunit delta